MGRSKEKININHLPQDKRLYHLPVPVIGLTGGIATGKSTVAKLLSAAGFAIINADELVKEIYKQKDTINFIKNSFPDAVTDDKVDFPKLREKVFNNTKIKEDVEKFIYSKLPEAFLSAFKNFSNPTFIIYDVPLLFEKNLKDLVDFTVVVYTPRELQKQRLIKRDGSSEKIAEAILNQQMNIEEKKQKADLVLDNSTTEDELENQVKNFIDSLSL